MGVRRASRLLVPVLVGLGSAHCSLTLDLDRYSFEKPSRGGSAGGAGSALAGQGGDAGEGGRAAGEGGMGEAAVGGSAGSSAGRGGGGAGGSGNGGGGGEPGGMAGASGEGGEGGSPVICNDETGPLEPRCELVPVAVYVTLSGGCTGPVALGVDALGHVSSTLATDMDECGGVHGDIVVTPDRRRVVALNGGGTGQITFTYNINATTHALTQSDYIQFESEAALSSWDDAAIRKGPSGSVFDFLFVTNEANDGDGGGLYALSINHSQSAGAIQEIGLRSGVNEARGVAVHPTEDFVYVIRDAYSLGTRGIVGLTFNMTGITGTVPSVPALDAVSGDIPNQLLVDPAGRILYLLTDLRIRSFAIAMNGSLTSYATTSDAPTAYLQRMALHPSGSFLYAAGADELVAFRLDGGALTPLDLDQDPLNGITGKALPDIRDLEVDASGRFLFLTTPTTTLSFAIEADGRLGADPLLPSVDQPGLRLAVLDEWRLRP